MCGGSLFSLIIRRHAGETAGGLYGQDAHDAQNV
jgi:hypothetical protein